ncbi:hypothetical protein HDZ31DRAFT_46433 [Schizophyllum fasciatum]
MSPPSLPLDIFSQVFRHFPASTTDDGSITLARCSQANSLLREAASHPALWEAHYRARYRHHHLFVDGADDSYSDLREKYMARRRLDRTALRHLECIVTCVGDKCNIMQELVALSFDVWDVLQLERNQPLPKIFQGVGQESDALVAPHALPRQYWAGVACDLIAKSSAMLLWRKLKEDSASVSFEEAMSALSCFCGHSLLEIKELFDDLAHRCRARLDEEGARLDTDDERCDVVRICTGICDFMRSEGFGPAEGADFRRVHHHFAHFYLTTHKKTLPLALVHVFVAIANRLGLKASPVDFPYRVIAHVSHPSATADDIYVDVYGADTRAILDLRTDIASRCMAAGIPPNQISSYIAPRRATPLLLRSARNIVSSEFEDTDSPRPLIRNAVHVSKCVTTLLSDQAADLTGLLLGTDTIHLDCATYLATIMAPALSPPSDRHLALMCGHRVRAARDEDSIITMRTSSDREIKYFVGMIFEHARYAYTGVIVGWSSTCDAQESWIHQMGVDQLRRGRHQPFYHVLDVYGQQRYVAEENITVDNDPARTIQSLMENVSSMGMYFEDAEIGEDADGFMKARLVLSPELQKKYPEDGQAGNAWMAESD